MLNSELTLAVISSLTRKLLDSGTYAIQIFATIYIMQLSTDSRDFSLRSK